MWIVTHINIFKKITFLLNLKIRLNQHFLNCTEKKHFGKYFYQERSIKGQGGTSGVERHSVATEKRMTIHVQSMANPQKTGIPKITQF